MSCLHGPMTQNAQLRKSATQTYFCGNGQEVLTWTSCNGLRAAEPVNDFETLAVAIY